MPDEKVKIKEASRLTGVPANTIRYWGKNGRLKNLEKVMGKVQEVTRYDVDEARQFSLIN